MSIIGAYARERVRSFLGGVVARSEIHGSVHRREREGGRDSELGFWHCERESLCVQQLEEETVAIVGVSVIFSKGLFAAEYLFVTKSLVRFGISDGNHFRP